LLKSDVDDKSGDSRERYRFQCSGPWIGFVRADFGPSHPESTPDYGRAIGFDRAGDVRLSRV
jgi:hypothetical protein